MRAPSLAGSLSVAALVGILLAPSVVSAQLEGEVRDESTDAPIAGAIVRLQGQEPRTFTDEGGRFSLAGVPAGGRVVAGAVGYFYAGADAPESGSLVLRLERVPHDPAAPVQFLDTTACSGCHAELVRDYATSAMAHAGSNTWVADLYAGNGTHGGAGGFVYTRDSPHAARHPASECAACHQPEGFANDPTVALLPPSDPSPTVTRGVSCLVCHQVAHIDESRPSFPGIHPESVTMARGTTVRYGVLGDVDYHAEGRMRGSYQPQLPAAVCAACHQDSSDPSGDGLYDGPISEGTYLEWLASPYADPSRAEYSTCMGCHSEPLDVPNASDAILLERIPGEVRSHLFEGTTPAFLERALALSLEVTMEGNEVRVTAALANTGTGHHVPTGVTMRNVVLLVEAEDDVGPLEAVGDQVVAEEGGVGDPSQGYYAGLPGKLYAIIHENPEGDGPVLFTDAVRIRRDDRLAALETDETHYRFLIRGFGEVRVRARAIYRRTFRSLADDKSWEEDGHGRPLADLEAPHFGHLMASASRAIDIQPNPDAGHAVDPEPSVPPSGCGCGVGASERPAGAVLLALFGLAGGLAVRRRAGSRPPSR